jgi:hypothetical protein
MLRWGGLRHHRIVLDHRGMLGELGQRDRRADLDRLCIGLDVAQLSHVMDVDQHRRRDDAAADIHHEIGAAADQAAVGMPSARLDHIGKRRRTDEIEVR